MTSNRDDAMGCYTTLTDVTADRVRVQGMAKKAPDAEAGYRDEAASWLLRDDFCAP